MKKNGFTLIELMIVIAIIALLAAVALPKFSTVTDDAKIANVRSNLSVLRTAINMFNAKYGVYPTIAGAATANINTNGDIPASGTTNGFSLQTYYDKSSFPDTPRGTNVQPVGTPDLNRVQVSNVTPFAAAALNSYGWRYRQTTGEIHADLYQGAYGDATINWTIE